MEKHAHDYVSYVDKESEVRVVKALTALPVSYTHLCYGITALLAVTIPHKRFMPLAIILLIVYFIFQLFGNGFEKDVYKRQGKNRIGIL